MLECWVLGGARTKLIEAVGRIDVVDIWGEDQDRVEEVLLGVQVEAQPQDEMLNRITLARGVWMELQKVRKHGTQWGEETGRESGELKE